MKLNTFVTKHEMLTGHKPKDGEENPEHRPGDIKIWSDDSKRLMEFANLLIKLYNKKYGVASSWFSDDEWFNK